MRTLLFWVCYAVNSCNFLPTFRDNLSALFRELAAVCCLISNFCHEVDEKCGVLDYYAVSSYNSLPTFGTTSVLSSRVWTIAGCVMTQKSAVPRPRPPTLFLYSLEVMPSTSRVTSFFSFTFLVASTKLRKATVSFVMFACPCVRLSAWNWAPTGRIFMKFCIWVYFENQSRKFKDFSAMEATCSAHLILLFRRVGKIFKRRLLASSCQSVRLCRWNNSAPTRRIFMKFYIWVLLKKRTRKFEFNCNLKK
jgi:hypothetical protein